MVERAEIQATLKVVGKEIRQVSMDISADRSDKVLVAGLNGILEMLGELVNDIQADVNLAVLTSTANPIISEPVNSQEYDTGAAFDLTYIPKSRPAFID